MDHGNEVSLSRRRRASRPKVKTGCMNCKNRRVKCDETRPQCINCVRSGRRCEGYPAQKRYGDQILPIAPRPISIASGTPIQPAPLESSASARALAVRKVDRMRKQKPKPKPKPRSSQPEPATAIILSPTRLQSGLPFADSQEGQYFQVFRTHTANELSGFFNSEFWTRSVLQESHSEASIRHAVIALGALYKTLEKAAESPPGSPDNNAYDTAPNHYNFALQQYGKSLRRLQESIGNNETRSQRTVLISIVLFTCIQSFTGDHKDAISQIQSGLGLLDERRQERNQPLIQQKNDYVEDELVQIFTRLAIQAKSYDMAFHFPHPYVIRLSPQRQQDDPTSPQSPTSPSEIDSTLSEETHIPEIFPSATEARKVLDAVCERIMRFNELLSSVHPGPNNILPKSIQSLGYKFKMQFQAWGEAFQPLLDGRRRQGVSNTERAGINVLRMIHLMSYILLVMSYSTSEMDFDNFMKEFKEIVELAGEVVLDEELSIAQARCGSQQSCRHKTSKSPARNLADQSFPSVPSGNSGGIANDPNFSHIKPSFALDLGIIPPLFVVATKCRDRKLRRDAIELLMCSPRREGMWDSILCGRAAKWIMEIEEEGMMEFGLAGAIGAGLNGVPGMEKRVMVKEILFDMQKREAILRCGTRGVMPGERDDRRRETGIWW